MKIFPTIELPSAKDGVLQPVTILGKGYTLVVFSASWCRPCRDEIPLLKDIYRDLHPQGLDIVYISMDEPATVGNWAKLMEDESIPWNSFMAATQMDAVKQLFPGIVYPTSFLVSPDGSFIRVEVRKEKEKLYSILRI